MVFLNNREKEYNMTPQEAKEFHEGRSRIDVNRIYQSPKTDYSVWVFVGIIAAVVVGYFL